MSKKSFAAGMLFGTAVGAAEIVKHVVRETSSDRVYIVSTQPQPQQPQYQQYPQYQQPQYQQYPQYQQPQYQQGGRPVQRGCYRNAVPLYKVHRETLDILDDIRDVCDGASHSIGRELAYQIHKGCASGWKYDYVCTHLARHELRDLARLARVYSVHPHDGDAEYRRLYREIMNFIDTKCEIIW